MAFLIDEKRFTSPTSSTQVNAVIGPTAGMVISRCTRRLTANHAGVTVPGQILSSAGVTGFPGTADAVASALMDASVNCQEILEVTTLAQLLFVIAYASFH